MSAKPLDGVRIVEVAMFAPDATGMHLADLGADVIKVEQPGLGDPARLLGVPFRGESAAARRWLGYEDLLLVNPTLVFAAVSGWGQEGPYRDLGSHGLAFDSFAGLASP